MKNGFRQAMAWLHTWVGLVVSWVLFFIFFTGTLGYFDTEIDRWMKPELPLERATSATAALTAQTYLEQHAPDAKRWFIALPIDRNTPNLRLFWEEQPPEGKTRGPNTTVFLDATTGETFQGRETGGGQLLYRMHYALHYLPRDVAYWLVGICTMFMFVAITTGVVIHKKIFKDFFTFRTHKGQRSWLDIHNVLSVMALPFYFMITYSGLIFFAFTYMGAIVSGSYGWTDVGRDRFFDELNQRHAVAERRGETAPLLPLDGFVHRVNADWINRNDQVRYLEVYNPGDIKAEVHVGGLIDSPSRFGEELVFDGVNGELKLHHGEERPTAKLIYDTLLGLHEGLFAGPLLRWLYFISGLLGTAMIATGLILWTVKRRNKVLSGTGSANSGFRLVEGLNVGTIVGIPCALAAFFWANRLLPIELDARANWEVNIMFSVMLIMLLHGLLRKKTRAWQEQLLLTALMYLLLPLLNGLTTERGFFSSLAAKDWVFVSFDLLVVFAGISFAAASRYLSGARSVPTVQSKSLGAAAGKSRKAISLAMSEAN